jgi:hypothetical protein
VQDLSVQVGDNDEPGALVDLVDGSLLVFEDALDNFFGDPADPRADLIAVTYRVVLTRSPVESVRITAASVPLRESEIRAGGKGIGMVAGPVNGGSIPSESGVSLLFDRNNWFVPQEITVFALADDLAEGRRFINIQHTVIQGAEPGDGGEYDSLIIPGVTVEVIDDDVAEVVVVETGDGTLVAEGTGAVPAFDTYAVLLSRAPEAGATVLIDVVTAGQLGVFSGATPITTPLQFTDGNWRTPQFVTVKALDDVDRESTHFSRIAHRLASAIDPFLNVRIADVARGLAAAVNADTSATYRATASGASLTVGDDAAFTAIHASEYRLIDAAASRPRSSARVTVQLAGELTQVTPGVEPQRRHPAPGARGGRDPG